jgi:hypothetical protein
VIVCNDESHPARFTQADLNRAIRAAKQAGAGAVLLLPDGTIRIELGPVERAAVDDSREEIVL